MQKMYLLHSTKQVFVSKVSILTDIDNGFDVSGILRDLTREAQAGKGIGGKKWGQNGGKQG